MLENVRVPVTFIEVVVVVVIVNPRKPIVFYSIMKMCVVSPLIQRLQLIVTMKLPLVSLLTMHGQYHYYGYPLFLFIPV